MLKRLVCGMGCLAWVFGVAATVSAQEIWSGYDVSFTKPNGADWTLAINQDRITPDTWITRQSIRGLFNIRTEAAFDNITRMVSPANTEWAYDLFGNGNDGQLMRATNFMNLTFEDWTSSHNGFPPGSVGLPGVLHLISEDIYIDIMVTVWGGDIIPGLGGGFSYVRAEDAPEPSSMLLNFAALTALAGLTRVRGSGSSRGRRRAAGFQSLKSS